MARCRPVRSVFIHPGETVDLLEFQIGIQRTPVEVSEYAEHSVIRALFLPKVPVRFGCMDAGSKNTLVSVEQSEVMSVLFPVLERR